jgi:hypothetical protein
MRFIISRTSGWDSGPKAPCDEAYHEMVLETQKMREPAEQFMASGKYYTWWRSDGINHRVEDGYAVRDMEIYTWFVDIASLYDLQRFIEKYGDVVIMVLKDGKHAGMMEVEIYDNYRE